VCPLCRNRSPVQSTDLEKLIEASNAMVDPGGVIGLAARSLGHPGRRRGAGRWRLGEPDNGRTTLAILVFFQREYVSAWQTLQAADPTYLA
jgi:hypothetical protein